MNRSVRFAKRSERNVSWIAKELFSQSSYFQWISQIGLNDSRTKTDAVSRIKHNGRQLSLTCFFIFLFYILIISYILLDKTPRNCKQAYFFSLCACNVRPTQTCVRARVTRLRSSIAPRLALGQSVGCLGTLSFLRAAVFVLDQPKALLLGVGTDSSLDSTFPLVKDWAAEAQADLSRYIQRACVGTYTFYTSYRRNT